MIVVHGRITENVINHYLSVEVTTSAGGSMGQGEGEEERGRGEEISCLSLKHCGSMELIGKLMSQHVKCAIQ